MTLYEINQQYIEFLQAVEDGGIPEEAIADTLAGLNGEFDEKADNIACLIKSLLSDAQAIKAEADALTERMKAKKHRADSLTDYLFQQFKLSGKTGLETSRNVLKIKKNPPAVQITDTEKFMAWAKDGNANLLNFKDPEPNKTAIKELLKNGEAVPFAELVDGEKLAIK